MAIKKVATTKKKVIIIKKTKSTKKPKKVEVTRMVTKRKTSNKFFPIVGIGASAGGLEALEGFFSNMPPQSNVAIVVIQHLAPKYKSIMGSLLQKYTSMKIVGMKDYMKVEPNCVYLNPPNKDVAIMNGKLQLMKPLEVHSARLPIDYFFRSLSVDQGEIAICIILSGTGTDGTMGLKAIKGAGGMTMVQSEKQAKYDSMPRSAIDTGLVDFILPVEKMPNELMKYVKHPYIEKPVKAVTAIQQYRNNIAKILMLIRASTGSDFSDYKKNTVHRRIERRMAVHQIGKIEEYVSYLRRTPAEVDTLYKDMLIGVTNFFRDPEAFDILKEKVLTEIIENKLHDSNIRIWVPGCATGEEVFSIAMLVVEIMEKTKKYFNVQIFGTDIDADAIEFARSGIYSDSIAADVTPKRLKRFFVKEDNTYKIRKQIREMTIFAVQNFIKDAPFSKLDLISCRNILIYMDKVLQKKILSLIHYSLNRDGFLFLGSSETVGEYVNLFASVNNKWKIYKRKPSVIEKGIGYPVVPFGETNNELQRGEIGKVAREANIRLLAEKIILESFGPPCVLINDKHEVVYFHGNTDVYLKLPAGEPSFDILKMIRKDLRYELSKILQRMIKLKQEKPVTTGELKVNDNGNFLTVEIIIKPIFETKALEGMMMVIFEDKTPEVKGARKKKKVTAVRGKKEDVHISSLKHELQSTKEYLWTTIEELETSNEELKTTNEELQSTNEELQSTNEELETSKEEQQSTNEELETVNTELQNKVDELSQTNNDLNNLLANTDIATVFLDTQFNIIRFTPAISGMFNLILSDIGRPISDINLKIKYDKLYKDLKEVLNTLSRKEEVIECIEGRFYKINISPYRTAENVIEGIVITLVDVTKAKQSESDLRRLATVVTDSNDAVTMLDLDGKIKTWNKGAEKMYGYTEKDILNKSIAILVPKAKKKEARDLLEQIKTDKLIDSLETQRIRKDGAIIDVWLTITKLVDDKGKVVSIATTERDVTERKYKIESYEKTIECLKDQLKEEKKKKKSSSKKVIFMD